MIEQHRDSILSETKKEHVRRRIKSRLIRVPLGHIDKEVERTFKFEKYNAIIVILVYAYCIA